MLCDYINSVMFCLHLAELYLCDFFKSARAVACTGILGYRFVLLVAVDVSVACRDSLFLENEGSVFSAAEEQSYVRQEWAESMVSRNGAPWCLTPSLRSICGFGR